MVIRHLTVTMPRLLLVEMGIEGVAVYVKEKCVGILSIDFHVADENDESMTRRLTAPRNVVAMCSYTKNREEQMLIY
jgi:hypothetical protein